jgi:hypothetical protein
MRRSATSGVAISAAFFLALLLAGCGQPAAPPATSTTTAPAESSPGATASRPASPTPTPSLTASAAWTQYTTADGELTFDFPAAWSIRDPAGDLPEGGGAFAEVTNQAGKPMATLRTNMAVGSACVERFPYSVLETEPMAALTQGGSTPRYVFETRGDVTAPYPTINTVAAYGIETAAAPTGEVACPIFHFFTWPPTSASFGAGYNPVNNETPGDPSLPYLEKARLYMGTPEYLDIKRMITSLRPTS